MASPRNRVRRGPRLQVANSPGTRWKLRGQAAGIDLREIPSASIVVAGRRPQGVRGHLDQAGALQCQCGPQRALELAPTLDRETRRAERGGERGVPRLGQVDGEPPARETEILVDGDRAPDAVLDDHYRDRQLRRDG